MAFNLTTKIRISVAIILLTVGLCMGMGNFRLRWKGSSTPPFPPPTITNETYYTTSDNPAGPTTLRWKTYVHHDVPRDFVVLVHGGGFRAGDYVQQSVATDLYYAGFNVVNILYRLADPGTAMHNPPNNQPADDHGLYPEQPADVAQAVIKARTGGTASVSGWATGRVFGVGGSAGATHVAHLTAAPLNGGDQFDCGALLSGAYDLHDPTSLSDTRCNTIGDLYRNYVGCATGPACDDPGGQLDLASAYRRFTSSSHPVSIFTTNNDVMPPNQALILKNKCAAVGSTYTYRVINDSKNWPQNGNCTRHEFQYWYPTVPDFPDYAKDDVINFLKACQASVATPTPTPTPTPSVVSYPKGVYGSYGNSTNIPAGLADNLGLVGVGIGVNWNDVQAGGENSYDWTQIDEMIRQAVAAGFTNIAIAVTDSSDNTPTWMFTKVGAQNELLFLDPASNHNTWCQYIQTVPYWNPCFHQGRLNLIAQMGLHFNDAAYPYRQYIHSVRMAPFCNHNSQDWNVQDTNGPVVCPTPPTCGQKPTCSPTPNPKLCQECGTAFPVNQPQQWINFAGTTSGTCSSSGGWTEARMLQVGKDIADACAVAFPNWNITLPIGGLSDNCMSTPDQDPHGPDCANSGTTHGNYSQMARDMELYIYGDGGSNPGKAYKNRFWMMRNVVDASWQCPGSGAGCLGWDTTPPGFASQQYIKYMIYNHARTGGTYNTPGHAGLQMVTDATKHADRLNQGNHSCDGLTGQTYINCVMQKALDQARTYGTTYIEVFPQDSVNQNFYDMIKAATISMGGTPRTAP